MYSIKGSNPTQMYYDALQYLVDNGEKVSPRGKDVLEVRPASLELTDAYNRITFLGGRRINPFFQLAESLWILSGRADVEFLTMFNKNMSQFSDDGEWFNASYGERMRAWGKNSLHNIIINPVDQLADVYTKLVHDHDTRQAIIVLTNPSFDNALYTIGEKGKDISCNLVLCFKIRDNRLHLTVFNRSNDLHWGVYGANLCQFTTIQEQLLAMLQHCEGLDSLQMGGYNQITDSLHIYTDDYGAKCTEGIFDYYKNNPDAMTAPDFRCVNEPRMSLTIDQFDKMVSLFWSNINPYLSSDDLIINVTARHQLINAVNTYHNNGLLDDYWYFAVMSMIAYRMVRLHKVPEAMAFMLEYLTPCQWMVSEVYFLRPFVNKLKDDDLYYAKQVYDDLVDKLAESVIDPKSSSYLHQYLSLGE